jgi:hypothetical protein
LATELVTVTVCPASMDWSWACVSVTVCVGSGPDDVYVAPPDGGLVRSAVGTQSECVWPKDTVDVVCTPSHPPPVPEGDEEDPHARFATGTRSNVVVALCRN